MARAGTSVVRCPGVGSGHQADNGKQPIGVVLDRANKCAGAVICIQASARLTPSICSAVTLTGRAVWTYYAQSRTILVSWWTSALPVGSAPEQPRQPRSAAGGTAVGCAAASLLQRYAGQHLINVLTASGVAGLAAGAARGGTAHEDFPSEELIVETGDPRWSSAWR